ncbi:MAG TPA: UbiA prenyltransferase family protein [Gemmatimonadaceae bacterium]|nr:UbiA prenyltransferase family protein [Gemmatimonadaceae bacterium]
MKKFVEALWRLMMIVDRFIRIHFIIFSCMLPLLGASTVRPKLRFSEILALLGVGMCFHIYAYVLNDVVDLPIDRTQALRQTDPLVRGTIRRWQALLVALAQIPLTIPLTMWLGGGLAAHVAILVGFVGMAIYNVWGKRNRVPPVTDAVQGMAWGSLAIYAAYAIGGAPNVLTWIVGAYGAGFILLINGIHGGLRDLANDLASGARTTAIFLGARPVDGAPPRVPAGVPFFAYAVSLGLALLSIIPLARNDFGYSQGVRVAMLLIIGACNVVALVMLRTVVRPVTGVLWDIVFRVQMLIVLLILPGTFAPFVSSEVLWTIIVLEFVSLLPLEWTYRILRLVALRGAPGRSYEFRADAR